MEKTGAYALSNESETVAFGWLGIPSTFRRESVLAESRPRSFIALEEIATVPANRTPSTRTESTGNPVGKATPVKRGSAFKTSVAKTCATLGGFPRLSRGRESRTFNRFQATVSLPLAGAGTTESTAP